MPEPLPNMPRFIIENEDGSWQGADHPDGPWRSTPADRLSLALCADRWPGMSCRQPCHSCRQHSTAVARELAQILRERHGGSSSVADWLDGVGCHA